ncbi:MAG: electron transport complex subunit RsxC [Deltaproteobacteria bacterium]|nr:electron transport complex subunit RsxC [Deltaproteobacteria bacterium]
MSTHEAGISGELRRFLRGGVSLEEHKEATAQTPITTFIPAEVTIPLAQHLGPPAQAIVKRKQVVQRGELIATAEPNGAPVHASVTGTVARVALSPHPTLTEAPAIVITVDPNAAAPQCTDDPAWATLPRDVMLARIEAAGIVGLGGAAFPTYRKLRLPDGVRVDTVVLNGAECEPYLTSDHRLMLESPKDVLRGAWLLAQIIGAQRVVIGVEDNKSDAAVVLQAAVEQLSLSPAPDVLLCRTRYPQGAERQLVEALTGRRIPARGLPLQVGVLVQNVATAIACYQAVRYQQPLLDRVLTVTGPGIGHPMNLRVPIGTLVQDIVAHCGGLDARTAMVIAGGPMMGRALGRLDVPVIKGTGGLLFLRVDDVQREPYGPCISCAACLDACPLGLEPNQISIYTEAGRALETESFGTRECFECGCCAYVCPAERPLVQFIQIAKAAFQTGSAIGLGVRPGVVHG